MSAAVSTIKCAVSHWAADQAATIGAALAFYCAFSIAPLLVILLATAGWIVGAEAAYGHVSSQLTALFGKPTAEILLQAMRSSQTPDGTIATIVSIGTLLLGATTVFAALEAALEQIWGARELAPKGFRGWVRSMQPSAFGAAASFAAMLLWLYYSAQIFLLGAEFTACIGGVRDAQPKKAVGKKAVNHAKQK